MSQSIKRHRFARTTSNIVPFFILYPLFENSVNSLFNVKKTPEGTDVLSNLIYTQDGKAWSSIELQGDFLNFAVHFSVKDRPRIK